MIRIVLAGFSVLVLSLSLFGCATHERVNRILDTSVAPPGENETIIVQGASDPRFNVLIFSGTIENGLFERKRVSVLSGRPMDGYLIGTVGANQKIAVGAVAKYRKVDNDRYWQDGPSYDICDSELFVFDTPPGKVIYIGDLIIHELSSKPSLNFAYKHGLASMYIDARFSQLAGKLEATNYQMIRAKCETKMVTTPYFIYMKK
jgi:hypothetical protein